MTKVKLLLLGLIGLVAGLAISFILFSVSRNGASPVFNPAGAYEGTALDAPAADFRLVDQNGANVVLSDFRGKVVALTFMDSQCVDTCPKTAAHFRQVYQTLGDEAAAVVFIGVNVNLKANHVVDVMLTTARWQLTEISTWHFLTGSAEELEPIWKAYDVTALPPSEDDLALVHTPGVFLIDWNGQKRWYVSTPYDETGGSQVSAPLNELLVKHIRELLSE